MITLVVLAAGMATRYGGDKQLEQVGPSGELLLEYALFDAWRAGCGRAVLVIREVQREVFEREVVRPWAARLPISLAVQRTESVPQALTSGRKKPWGTVHAVLAAADQVEGDLLICNADDFYGPSAYRALVGLLQEKRVHGVAGYPLGNTLSEHGGVSRAICQTEATGRLLRIEELTGIARAGAEIRDDRGRILAAATPVSMNLWAFRHSFLPALAAGFERFVRERGHDPQAELRIPDVVNEEAAAGEVVQVAAVQEQWFGMTYAADRAAVRAALAARVAAGEYPDNLEAV